MACSTFRRSYVGRRDHCAISALFVARAGMVSDRERSRGSYGTPSGWWITFGPVCWQIRFAYAHESPNRVDRWLIHVDYYVAAPVRCTKEQSSANLMNLIHERYKLA